MAKLAALIMEKAKKADGGGASSLADKIRARAAEPSEEAKEADEDEESGGMSDELYRSVAEDIASGDVGAIAAGLRSLCEAMKG